MSTTTARLTRAAALGLVLCTASAGTAAAVPADATPTAVPLGSSASQGSAQIAAAVAAEQGYSTYGDPAPLTSPDLLDAPGDPVPLIVIVATGALVAAGAGGVRLRSATRRRRVAGSPA